jgi:hypothetical protein
MLMGVYGCKVIEKEVFGNTTGTEKRVKWNTIKLDIIENTWGQSPPQNKVI